jgi:hypothetical protein
MLNITDHVALKYKSRVKGFPWFVMRHLYSERAKYLRDDLVHLGVGELEVVSTYSILYQLGQERTCLPMQVLVPAPNTSMAFSMAQYCSSLSSHLSGRNSYGSSPKTPLSYCVTIAFIPILIKLALTWLNLKFGAANLRSSWDMIA